MVYQFKDYQKSEILTNHLNMGGENPNGSRIDVTSRYFTRDGKPWIGVMGEYHFVRDSRDNWYRELCKMKAGGITVTATYLFWIYHEETEGEFDFTGDRDIRRFISDAQRAGLDVIIRIGPWAHGECRNRGLPDWLLHKSYKLRDNNSEYMAKVRIWYEKIYEQVRGLFYADGGMQVTHHRRPLISGMDIYALSLVKLGSGNTYFFAAVDGIEAEYKFEDGSRFHQKPDSILTINGIQIVTLSWNKAKYARKLSDTLYIGDNCDLYKYDENICSVQGGDFAYDKWNGSEFEHTAIHQKLNQADVTFESVDEPFIPPYADELNIDGERKRIWKKVSVSNDTGFIEIQDQYDVAQIYADGEFVADNFYYGKPWRVPARMLYDKVCYLVMSEMKDDFYREF